MPIVDVTLVKRKIKFLDEDLKKLQKFKNLTLKKYLEDDFTKMVVERLLEKITGRMIDINYHILKTEYEVYPEDYYNSFVEIGRNKVVNEKLANQMTASAGLRNALAHEYEKIDDGLVYKSIKIALTQVPKYLKEILEFLDWIKKQ